MMELEQQKRILTRAAYWLLVGGAGYVTVRYLLPFLTPFVVGFAIAWMLQPVVGFICRHSGMNRKGAAVASAAFLYLLLGLALWLAGSWLAVRVEELFANLPELYAQRIAPLVNEAGRRLGIIARQMSLRRGQESQILSALEGALQEMVASASAGSMAWLGKVLQATPGVVVGVLFTILSSVLICTDYRRVTGFMMDRVPSRYRPAVLELKEFLQGTLKRIVKAYLILMVITFGVLALGLGILGVKGFLAISAVIAVLDLLPVIGSGVVLVPWGVYALLGGETYLGVGLLVLWAGLSILREVLEPRILGSQIGLHPLAALLSMYLGLKLAGFLGLVAAPVLCLLAVRIGQMNKS